MRVYEMAKEKGVPSKELVDLLVAQGFPVSSHMSVLPDEAVSYIDKYFGKPSSSLDIIEDEDDIIEKPKVSLSEDDDLIDDLELVGESAPVKEKILIKSKKIEEEFFVNKISKSISGKSIYKKSESEYKSLVPEIIIEGDKPLFEVAELMGKGAGELIFMLMKSGIVCNRNYVLSKDMIISLAKQFGVNVIQKEILNSDLLRRGDGTTLRWPIIVVMGHVDHGKTSLLDFIRKTNVAAKEKGGITQHLGAYEIVSSHGKLVFLDTPGHAAFSRMRKRGAKITDIVVLVVAADDGVMPQTLEAINVAKEAGVPIVVAVNKIDKVNPKTGLEPIKRQLSQHGLLPEDWGGDVMVVPVSAKTGEGINDLLDMLILQAEIMELKATPDFPAKAFVLESNIEKGYGPVSTAICVDGSLRQGDYFLCGETKGRVRLLVDSTGAKLQVAGPSIPVKVVGFESLPISGDILQVVSCEEYAKKRDMKFTQNLPLGGLDNTKDSVINLIIKADTYGSVEAILDVVKTLGKGFKNKIKKLNIIFSGIGSVSEGDVALARDTDSILIAMNTSIEKNAISLAKEFSVKFLEHNIIYRLIEDLEQFIKDSEVIPLVFKKVAEATVIKIFDVKGIGIIAGSRVSSGVFVRNAVAVCVRSGREIGKAKITSLERNKKSVKEVHIDSEFAFITKDFQDWQVGDVVHCMAEVPKEK